MRLPGVLLLFLVWLAALASASGQGNMVVPDSLGLLETQVKRIGINTYTGYNFISSAHQTDSQRLALVFSHNWIYNSNTSVKGFIRNDYRFGLQQHNRLGNKGFGAGQRAEYSEFQANRTSILRLLQEYTYELKPDSNWQINSRAFGGIRRDERFGRADFGPEFGGTSQVRLLPVPGFGSGGANVLLSKAQVGPRQFNRLQADVFYASPENLPAAVEARAGYYKVNSADYLGGNVQNIRTDTLFADLRLYYRLNKDLSFRSASYGTMPQRQFIYRQQSGGVPEQQNFGYLQGQYETSNRLRYYKNNLDAGVEFTYRERNRSYSLQNNRGLAGTELRNAEERERTKDVRENNYSWAWNVAWRFKPTQTLVAQTNAQLLRLDTPSNLNNQDRDEIYYTGKISLESRWQPGFRTTFAIAAEDKQFVFITAQQSIENYRDRILRWEPGFLWVQGRFSWTGQMQLWATYHVRDQAVEQIKNRSNRTYLQTHLLAYNINKPFRVQLQFTRRENRTGLLNWENFSESPLDTVISNDISVTLEWKKQRQTSQTVIRSGYRLFRQGQYRVAGRQSPAGGTETVYLHDITRQHGPEFSLLHHKPGFIDVSATVWLQVVDTFVDYTSSSEPFFGTIVTEQQLQQKLHAVYPYFSCSLSWYIGGLLNKGK